MGHISVFGMIFGVGNNHWRYLIRICLVSNVVRTRGWRIINSSEIKGLNGIDPFVLSCVNQIYGLPVSLEEYLES